MSYSDFSRGITAREVQYRKEQQTLDELRARWSRAEQMLQILRSVEFVQTSDKARFVLWRESAEGKGDGAIKAAEFPSSIAEKTFGPVILPGNVANLELLAASLGHCFSLVHVPDEGVWYFQDYSVGAFRPTTDAKVALLVSALITRRALEAPEPLRTQLIGMRPLVMEIVTVARHLLAADPTFFSGELGAKRFIDGRLVESMKAPSYTLFAESHVEPMPEAILTMSHAYHRYWTFCQPRLFTPVRRTEFKEKFTNETLTRWGIGMRNDLVVGEKPRICQGWKGLTLRSAAGLN